MTVDQADDVAAHAARHGALHGAAEGLRPRGAAAGRSPWPDAPAPAPAHVPADGRAVPGAPAPEPGLAGRWPTPHEGVPRTARRVLPAEITAPRTARDFTAATLGEWGLDDDAGDVLVTVSELVTNALRHGLEGLPQPLPRRPIQLVLIGHRRRLVVAVTDPSGRAPEPAAVAADRFVEGGRGLLVVGAVSDAWGWAPLATGGKSVWAAFARRVSPPGPEAPETARRPDVPAPDAPAH
ncbi:ATP-binding protein [Actinomadura algeriensis]|uniref:Anti-sigma regulatory factor (Ser/Thr protein kinase) n=1 Tax=Actinomadura algeriensis TaxID=1679523 RepID=A0ABR9JYC2_9ACTN|nr:ATP-binding protein [Actinomadura algeriensis]MBE1535453.1 anti-sigma regulatory factor (Ser/Thr protein kinase) [Actinomadura algeriensis]